jgi:hypothetical protein
MELVRWQFPRPIEFGCQCCQLRLQFIPIVRNFY